MTTSWTPLTEARPPARPRAFPGTSWLGIAGWFILATILWIPIILVIFYAWSVIT